VDKDEAMEIFTLEEAVPSFADGGYTVLLPFTSSLRQLQ